MHGSRARRCVALAVMVAAAMIALPTVAGAATHNPHGKFLGVVPPAGSPAAKKLAQTGANLDYNGGPVMHANKAYVIYWQPSGYYISPSYRSEIEQHLKDVAASSFLAGNQWGVEQQYYDVTGGVKRFLETDFSWGGSFVDTHAFPANGCSDSATAKCLSDAQLRAELQSFMTAHGLTGGLDREYFILTPPSVGSCFDSTSSSCAFTNYCAYHSSIGSGSTATIYTNQPYTAGATSSCDAEHYPNGNFADATVSTVSHEFRESITDPLGTGWWNNSTGNEGSDQCAWNFGTWKGSTGANDDPGGFPFGDSNYNQVLNNHYYAIQQEWSNAGSKCLQKNSNTPPTGVTLSHGTVTHGSAATFTATGSDPDGIYRYEWYWGDGTSTLTNTTSTTHTYSTAGSKTVTLLVIDNKGTEAHKTATVAVG